MLMRIAGFEVNFTKFASMDKMGDMLDLSLPPVRPLVAASILSADFGIMAQECQDVLAKGADLLHVDVMDGHFVPNLTMGIDMVRALRKHCPETFLDVHLMVEHPDHFVDMFAHAGSNLFGFHLEVISPYRSQGVDARALIARIHKLGMKAAMVVNPPTPVEGLEPYLPMLDMVLVMSVNPGRSGQKFMPEVLEKVRWLKQRVGANTRIQMDGGINLHTAPHAVSAGADVLVTASALFGTKDRALYLKQLHHADKTPGIVEPLISESGTSN